VDLFDALRPVDRSAFQFEAAFWRSRLPVLLAAGSDSSGKPVVVAAFGAGQRMIVMVKYTADTATEKLPAAAVPAGDFRRRHILTITLSPTESPGS